METDTIKDLQEINDTAHKPTEQIPISTSDSKRSKSLLSPVPK